MGRVYFRADGNSNMGLGHVVRCSALAENLGDEYETVLVTRCNLPDVIRQIESSFNRITILDDSESVDEELAGIRLQLAVADIVVLDGYEFTESYQEHLRQSGASIVCIDDIHRGRYLADAVINSAGGITPMNYNSLVHTQFFLGAKYTLLRPTFLNRAVRRRRIIDNRSVFLCLGGADPNNRTLEVLKFIESRKLFEQVRVVIGGGFQYKNELSEYIRTSGINAIVLASLSADEMADEMMGCSYAICTPSTVCFEFMTLGGVTFLEKIADNQTDMINYLTSEKLAFHLHQAGAISTADEQISLQKQAGLFDGQAGIRLKKLFQGVVLAKNITIRNVDESDLQICYEWANDSAVREQSFSINEVEFESHVNWFHSKLLDSNCYFYMLEFDSVPFAQIRFHVADGNAVISYLISEQFRGRGFGAMVLAKGIESFIQAYRKPIVIVGYVKDTNISSQRSFEKFRFIKELARQHTSSYKYTITYEGD